MAHAAAVCQLWHVPVMARAESGTLLSMANELTNDEQQALDELLPTDLRSGVLADDLAQAARVAMQRRVDNSAHGGAVIAALHRQLKSWRLLETVTGIPQATARRWATPPPGTESPPGSEIGT